MTIYSIRGNGGCDALEPNSPRSLHLGDLLRSLKLPSQQFKSIASLNMPDLPSLTGVPLYGMLPPRPDTGTPIPLQTKTKTVAPMRRHGYEFPYDGGGSVGALGIGGSGRGGSGMGEASIGGILAIKASVAGRSLISSRQWRY